MKSTPALHLRWKARCKKPRTTKRQARQCSSPGTLCGVGEEPSPHGPVKDHPEEVGHQDAP
eukprot:4798825-Prorocentrum_lima.AAC.1